MSIFTILYKWFFLWRWKIFYLFPVLQNLKKVNCICLETENSLESTNVDNNYKKKNFSIDIELKSIGQLLQNVFGKWLRNFLLTNFHTENCYNHLNIQWISKCLSYYFNHFSNFDSPWWYWFLNVCRFGQSGVINLRVSITFYT